MNKQDRQDLVEYRIAKARETFNEIKTTTHGGVRQMFGLHFIKTGKIEKELGKLYSDIFDMRQSGDYEDYVEFTKDDVLDLLIPADNLIISIENILKTK